MRTPPPGKTDPANIESLRRDKGYETEASRTLCGMQLNKCGLLSGAE